MIIKLEELKNYEENKGALIFRLSVSANGFQFITRNFKKLLSEFEVGITVGNTQ